MSFDAVEQFEKEIASFYGAPYAVATDSCTHAIELCLRYKNIKHTACPKHTYLSVPMTLEKLGLRWRLHEARWKEYYHLANTNIIDAAVYWKRHGYIPGTLMCLSFQFKKHLSLGRGGMILCDSALDHAELIRMSYDGRHRNAPWAEQEVYQMGYHYYMTPETAELGLTKLNDAATTHAKTWTWSDYPNLSQMPLFKNK